MFKIVLDVLAELLIKQLDVQSGIQRRGMTWRFTFVNSSMWVILSPRSEGA